MKAYELMKLTKENPEKYKGKKYRCTNGAIINFMGNEHNEFCINEYGEFVDNDNIKRMYITDTTEVEEIQQPVSFMEAIKAYAEGKVIICTLNSRANIYKPKGKHGYLIDHCGGGLTAAEILEGTWYIEREE